MAPKSFQPMAELDREDIIENSLAEEMIAEYLNLQELSKKFDEEIEAKNQDLIVMQKKLKKAEEELEILKQEFENVKKIERKMNEIKEEIARMIEIGFDPVTIKSLVQEKVNALKEELDSLIASK